MKIMLFYNIHNQYLNDCQKFCKISGWVWVTYSSLWLFYFWQHGTKRFYDLEKSDGHFFLFHNFFLKFFRILSNWKFHGNNFKILWVGVGSLSCVGLKISTKIKFDLIFSDFLQKLKCFKNNSGLTLSSQRWMLGATSKWR